MFSVNNAKTTGPPEYKKKKIKTQTLYFHKTYLKWIIDLNVKCKMITLLEDKIEKKSR